MNVVVVTGAASGMGRAAVERARAIADVVIAVDVQDPAIGDTIGMACDITDPVAIQALTRRVTEVGTFRALIHAAGISPTMGDARRVLAVNLVGTQLLLDAFDELVVAGSAAVCFASSAGHHIAPHVQPEWEAMLRDPLAADFLDRAVEVVGSNSGFAYGLSKFGVMRAASRAAGRWGGRGGRVVSLSPGLIDTPMGRQELANQPVMKQMVEQTPLRRMGTPDEVAAVAVFLVSDDASFITGIDVLVDGGLVRAGTASA